MTRELLSVIIPVADGGEFLNQALSSVMAQNYQPLEVCIVDVGSFPASQSYGEHVQYLRCDPCWPAAARNRGLARAQGSLIAFLDADDLFAPGHLGRLSAMLAADATAGIAQGGMRNWRFSKDGGGAYCSPGYRFASLCSSVFRRSVFDQVGCLDESLRFGEDSDFFLRCWEQGIRKLKTEEVSLLYRRHGGNMTANKDLRGLGVVQVYKRRLDRIRRGYFDVNAVHQETLREFLGEPALAYDDGGEQPVGAEVLDHLVCHQSR